MDGGKMGMKGMMGKMGMMEGKGWGKPMMPAAPAWDYKPGMYYEEPGGHVGIEGLKDAVTRACEPHAAGEQQWSRDDMINKVCMAIFKTSAKWYKEDARHKEP